ncbi:MAG: hypothetical protein JW828_04000 [Sedimentisphaerales bacterium]|nr:hypothetical protein [Sedimentisphaerales bacterium]
MMTSRVIGLPCILVVGMLLAAGSAQAGLFSDLNESQEPYPALKLGDLWTLGQTEKETSGDIRTSQDILDLSSEWGLLPVSAGVAGPLFGWIHGLTVHQKETSSLLGLMLFRSRNSKKQFRPVSDSDVWQIIYSRASMVC